MIEELDTEGPPYPIATSPIAQFGSKDLEVGVSIADWIEQRIHELAAAANSFKQGQ